MHRCPTFGFWLNHQLKGCRWPRGVQTTPGPRSAYVSLQTPYLSHLRVGLTQNPRFEREDWHQGGRSPKENDQYLKIARFQVEYPTEVAMNYAF